MRRSLAIAILMLLLIPATARANATDVAPHVGHTPLAANTIAATAVRDAMHLRGVPYVWSGSTPAGFDCSGFTSYVYGKLGITLAHSSYAQWTSGPRVPHVGIYIGGGQFIHAPHTGTVVSVDRLSGSWYGAEYDGAVRPRGSGAVVATMAGWRSHSTRPRRSERALHAVSVMTSSPGW